jgi:hypothetical protein
MITENNSTPQSHDEAPIPGVGSSVWFGSEKDPMKWFRLTVTERSSHTISGTVEEVTAWNMDNTAADFALYLTFYMKWDGCCHVWFGEKEDGKQDGYLHLCGANCWEKHIFLMAELYRWAERAIPMQTDTSGRFSPNVKDQRRPAND